MPTLPLFVHERLSTKAILETLTGHERDRQMEMQLFADPQLPLHQQLEAYEHKGGWVNRMILGDSLVVMNSLLEYEGLGGQVQMIYIDPPYGVKFGSNFQPFVRKRDVKNNDDDDMTREPEMVKAYRDTWELGLHSYLTYLRDRLLVARELLTPSGSVFVQISRRERAPRSRAAGRGVRRGELRRRRSSFTKTTQSNGRRAHRRRHVTTCSGTRETVERAQVPTALPRQDRAEGRSDRSTISLSSTDADRITPQATTVRGDSPCRRSASFECDTADVAAARQPLIAFVFDGGDIPARARLAGSRTSAGLQTTDRTPSRICRGAARRSLTSRYLDDFPCLPAHQRVGRHSSGSEPERWQALRRPDADEGHRALHPDDDRSRRPRARSDLRLRHDGVRRRAVGPALDHDRHLARAARARAAAAADCDVPVLRAPGSKPRPGGGLRLQAPAEQEGRGGRRDRPARHAQVDRERRAAGRGGARRPAGGGHEDHAGHGPFVVEATIPTPVDFEGDGTRTRASPTTRRTSTGCSRRCAATRCSSSAATRRSRSGTSGRPAQALTLSAEAALEPDDAPVAIVFGPENGAVSEKLVYEAAREAHLKSYEQLLVIGFAIEPNARALVEKIEAQVGIPATYVQATPDLVMGDLLKTMRSSQLFSVSGLPDVAIRKVDPEEKGGPQRYEVELLGLDTFDPTTFEATHRDGDDVPAWFLDTAWNGLSFHVSQAFFPRTSAWDNLKKALKTDFEESVWDHLSGTVSAPFTEGDAREIAVKVIDDRGNELLVVKSLDEAE